ncbi:hypothetical protein DS831_04575 [Bombilactobacillus bombi]|uniref:Uncharacterized protein n=1 Tax=Bombilactobacillus bombi TaxID=1303590 RepID=A0A417ZHV2_9LACO|nr:hypothetical protein [Bombilactobacillus bombi]RHW51301.1 hypothetical protein DS831_04575 [Bombilactobacillus bombi]
MRPIRDWKVQALGKPTDKLFNGPINLDGNPANFTWGLRLTTPSELKVLKKMANDERERQYEDAICETESIFYDYWQGDLTGSQVSDEISSLWAKFGKRGEHDK